MTVLDSSLWVGIPFPRVGSEGGSLVDPRDVRVRKGKTKGEGIGSDEGVPYAPGGSSAPRGGPGDPEGVEVDGKRGSGPGAQSRGMGEEPSRDEPRRGSLVASQAQTPSRNGSITWKMDKTHA